jgi:hypothetical protein
MPGDSQYRRLIDDPFCWLGYFDFWSPLSRSMVHAIKLILQRLPYAAFGFTQRDVLLCRGLVISVLEQSLSDTSAFAPRRACNGEGAGKWSSRILPYGGSWQPHGNAKSNVATGRL